MADFLDVSTELVARLRSSCLALPDAYEEQAWIGTRWRVRKKTFGHVLRVAPGGRWCTPGRCPPTARPTC